MANPAKFIMITAMVMLNACAHNSESHLGHLGNFTASLAPENQVIAADAVAQISSIFPPAKTQLALQQPATDDFGITLVNSLRNRGYAVAEYVVAEASHVDATASEEENTEIGEGDLTYVLDNIAETNLYLLKISVGQTSLTRPYKSDIEGVTPAGYWVQGGSEE